MYNVNGTKKWILPTDAHSGQLTQMQADVENVSPSARALAGQLFATQPKRGAVQWASARAGQKRFGLFVTHPLGCWTNLATYLATPPRWDAPPRVLGAHTDRLNATFKEPAWFEHVTDAELAAVMAGVDPCELLESRDEALDELRDQCSCADEEETSNRTIYETTAAFNVVTEGALQDGFLILLVGTIDGSPLPKGDAPRIRLIMAGKALLSFLPLNHVCPAVSNRRLEIPNPTHLPFEPLGGQEILFSAGVITHMGTPLRGHGSNARVILYETEAVERAVGHFERATQGTEPHLMDADDKKKAIAAGAAISDTSTPDDLTEAQLHAALAEYCSGTARGVTGNIAAALSMQRDDLAEYFSGDDSLCHERKEAAALERSTTSGVCIRFPAIPSMEPRHMLNSTFVRKRSKQVGRPPLDGSRATQAHLPGAVLETQFATLAPILSAPFAAYLLRETNLLELPVGSSREDVARQRKKRGEELLEKIRYWGESE